VVIVILDLIGDMAISVIEGRPGTGKTVFLVVKIFAYLNAGYEVYTNVEIKLSPDDKRFRRLHFIKSLEDILTVRHGKVVLDEIQTYLNSRNWDKLDVKFQLLLQQHRKRGLDIIGATQSVKRADVVFRELVHYFYVVSKIFTIKIGKNIFGLFIVREYDADAIEVDKTERGNYRVQWLPQMVVADPFIFKMYDTTQEVKLEDDLGKVEVIRRLIVDKPVRSYKVLSKEVLDG